MRRILELDGIRALAIMAVICCHYYPFSVMVYRLPELGWLGVDLFFVLSGFLITSILLDLRARPHPYKVFYIRRILRIFPPYYAVMIAVIIIASLQHDDSFTWIRFAKKAVFLQSFGSEIDIVKRAAHALTGARLPDLFGMATLPPTLDRFPVSRFSNSFAPTWSLSIEEWFYILWAPLALRARRRTLGIICIATCLGALLIRWLGFAGIRTYFDFASRVDMLLWGALLALWMERRQSLSPRRQNCGDTVMFAISFASGLLFVWILVSIRPLLGYEIRESALFMVFGLPLAGLSLAGILGYVILNAGSQSIPNRILRYGPLVGLGTVSYTLYLVHVSLYFLVSEVFSRLMGYAPVTYRSALVVSIVSAAVSVSVAWISFRYIESPILKYKDKVTRHVIRSSMNSPLTNTLGKAFS